METEIGGAQLGPTYLFFPAVLGTPGDPVTAAFSGGDPLTMDETGNLTGSLPGGYLTGTVAGTSFTGTVSTGGGRGHPGHSYSATGTVSHTTGGYELDARYTGASGAVTAFTLLGCRAN